MWLFGEKKSITSERRNKMKKEKFMKEVVGCTIIKVNLKNESCTGRLASKDDIIIETIELDNRKGIYLYGSPEIDDTDVFADILSTKTINKFEKKRHKERR